MKRSCFLILLLLAAVSVNASSPTAFEGSSFSTTLGRDLKELLAKAKGGVWSKGGENGAKKMGLVKVGEKEGIAHKPMQTASATRCITAEYCQKKKVVCIKKCSHNKPRDLGKRFPKKCVLKCTKCVPTC